MAATRGPWLQVVLTPDGSWVRLPMLLLYTPTTVYLVIWHRVMSRCVNRFCGSLDEFAMTVCGSYVLRVAFFFACSVLVGRVF